MDRGAQLPGNSSVDYAIDLVGVSKRFRRRTLSRGGYTTLKSALLGGLFGPRGGRPAPSVTHAIRGLTMRIPKRASLGVIGRNGSGKSTLLKLITGIYRPTEGAISVRGRVAALIELGAGFHPDFSGRENLLLAGVMYGLTRREIDRRADEIIEFAELADVIDDPIRTYSSGMYMRLGFSVAVHSDPDILLVDEVLSVGDAAFVRKCRERIGELRRRGVTLLLVSHDLEAVERWSDEVIWLDRGEVQDRGEPRRVIDAYRESLEHGEEQGLAEARNAAADESEAAPGPECGGGDSAGERWGSREVELTAVRLLDGSGSERALFHPDDAAIVEIEYRVNDPLVLGGAGSGTSADVGFGIGISRVDGTLIHGSNTFIESVELPALGASGTVRYAVRRLGLLEGRFFLDAAVHRADGYPFDYRKRAVSFVVRSPVPQLGLCVPEHEWSVEPADAAALRARRAAEG